MPVVLGRRALNRALLARQHLLERVRRPPLDVVAGLVGLQAQNPQDPYVALWSRIDGFDPEALSAAIADRRAVRLTLWRSTVHLATAADAVAGRPLVDPVVRASVGRAHRKQLAGLDVDEVAAVGRELLSDGPLTAADLRPGLLERFPGRDPLALTMAVAAGLPLVQVPPRGLWGRGGRPVLAPLDVWIPRDEATSADGATSADRATSAGTASIDDVFLRYFAAFGPATLADFRAWSGLTGLADVVARLRPRLRTFEDERGRELLDVPDGLFADEDARAPPRFLPEYDNLLLAHADRERVVAWERRLRDRPVDGFVRTVLVDGFVAGRWRPDADTGVLEIRLLEDVPRDALVEEGERLMEFLSPESKPQIRFV